MGRKEKTRLTMNAQAGLILGSGVDSTIDQIEKVSSLQPVPELSRPSGAKATPYLDQLVMPA